MTDKETRDYITPYAFGVHPDLLGLPLARPSKRLFALLLDLLLAAIFSGLGGLWAGALLVSGYTLSVWRKNRADSGMKRLSGINWKTVFLLVLVSLTASIFEDDDSDDVENNVIVTDSEIPGNQVDWAEFGKEMAKIGTDSAAGIAALEAVQQLTNEAGYDSATGLKNKKAKRLLLMLDSLNTQIPDTAMLNPVKKLALEVGKRVDSREARVKTLEKEIEQLEEKVENPGILGSLKAIAEDVGLGFGWIAAYFVLAMIWMDGQTPAKKLFRVKVVKLNGEKLTWWNILERFGGYAAGISTGLLGFAQIYWDANRMAIQDKIAETVVIDLKREKKNLDA